MNAISAKTGVYLFRGEVAGRRLWYAIDASGELADVRLGGARERFSGDAADDVVITDAEAIADLVRAAYGDHRPPRHLTLIRGEAL